MLNRPPRQGSGCLVVANDDARKQTTVTVWSWPMAGIGVSSIETAPKRINLSESLFDCFPVTRGERPKKRPLEPDANAVPARSSPLRLSRAAFSQPFGIEPRPFAGYR